MIRLAINDIYVAFDCRQESNVNGRYQSSDKPTFDNLIITFMKKCIVYHCEFTKWIFYHLKKNKKKGLNYVTNIPLLIT